MADERPRSATRLKGEAPAGFALTAEEGRQRIGRYEIIKTIGKGAMGIVYKARDPLLDRIVAVKTISSPQGQGKRVRSAFLERFQREAKAAAKMQHPAIVTIFDVGVDEESSAPFMVLEYLPGESLADRLDRVRIPIAKCVSTALDLASALAFAHRQRIVHRDVKPANVLHAGDDRWKLADFGIARMPDSDLTQVGIFMGTPGYSPPEAIREGRYTPQADVFAWGACLYELLSGRIPYEGPDTKTTNSYVVAGTAPPPTKHDGSIPGPISDVVMTALQPNAHQRYKDGGEAEAALKDAWQRCMMEAMVHPVVLAMTEQPHDKATSRFHEPRGGAANNASGSRTPAPPAAVAAVAAAAPPPIPKKGPADFVIESQGGIDDDPTTILVREDLKATTETETTAVDGRPSDSVIDPPPPAGTSKTTQRTKGRPLEAARSDLAKRSPIGKNIADRGKRGPGMLIAIAAFFVVVIAGVTTYLLTR